MSNEENQDQKKVEEKKEVSRGDRGEIGPGTARTRMLRMWREKFFIRENAQDKHNPNKRVYVSVGDTLSLKEYARQLAKEGDATANEWLANKLGAKRQKRSENNAKLAKLIADATKAKRRADSSKKK